MSAVMRVDCVQIGISQIPAGSGPLPSNLPLELLLAGDFLVRLIGQNVNIQAAAEMVAHLCWENREISMRVISNIYDGVVSNVFEDISPFGETLGRLFAMEDSLQQSRTEHGLGTVFAAIDQSIKHRSIVSSLLQSLNVLAKAHPLARKYLFENRQLWLEKLMFGCGPHSLPAKQ
jgi:hypothetical protein